MNKKLNKILLVSVVAVFVCCCVLLTACNKGSKYDGLFAGTSHDYVLTDDYTLTAEDVKATNGKDNVTLDYVCTFDLGGHTLNLGGYTLNITSDSDKAVKFTNGKITNGALHVSVPKGDIEFTKTDIDKTVTYELEAASETIRFSNAVISGKCTVKSNTSVKIEYSNVTDITLAGNGSLTAGSGATLGAVTVSEQAVGAKVNVTPSASVKSMELQAAASVSVEGSVSSVKVAETAKSDNHSLSIDIKESASVDKVELNAAASVSVAGSVQAVVVAETAKSDSATLSINVADTAEIARVELNAPAAVEVKGGVSNIVVAEKATGSSVTIKETATVETVAVNAGNTKIESSSNKVSNVVVAEKVKDTVESNVEVTTVTEDEMKEYLAHQHIWIVLSRVEATCTADGEVNSQCECGETSKKIINALGHDYTYSVVNEPNADEKGTGLYHCERCGHEYTVEIDNYVSVSFAMDALHALFSLIPDGCYAISNDTAKPFKIEQKDGMLITATPLEGIFEVRSGNLSGTVKGLISYSDPRYSTDIEFRAIIEDNIVHAYYNIESASPWGDYQDEGGVSASLSGLLNMGLAELLPFDPEELSKILEYLESDGGNGVGLPAELPLLKKIIEKIATVETENGNTVYTLDTQKLIDALSELGEMTSAELIDEISGEGTFADIKRLVTGIADKKVIKVGLQLNTILEKHGVSAEEVFSLVQTLVDYVMPDADLDFAEVLSGYYDKTIAEVLAELGGMTVEEAKGMIENYVTNFIAIAENITVSELIDMFVGNDEEESFYQTILAVAESYVENATLSFTLNSDKELVGYEISYIDENSGIKVSINKNVGSVVPTVDIDLFEAFKAEVTETENGAKIDINIMGVAVSLTGEKTESGASLDFTLNANEEITADINVAVTVKKDTANNAYKTTFDVNGNVSAYESENIVVSGRLNFEKNDGKELDSDVWNSFGDAKAMFYHMDSTFYNERYSGDWKYTYQTARIQYVAEESEEYYLLTKTEWKELDEGTILETVSTAKLLSVNGLPDVLLAYETECTDWVDISIICTARAEVTQTLIKGTIKELTYGFTIANEVRGESEELGTQSTDFYVNGYYNVKTGETSSSSHHDYVVTGKFAEGSNSCEDGIIVTKTCSICGKTQTTSQTWHYYLKTETPLKTQCSDKTLATEGECVVCHDKRVDIEYLHDHDMSWLHKTIVTEQKYNDYLEKGDGKGEENIADRYVNIADLANYGFNVTGFYYGYLDLEHCILCGLNVYTYTYYTHTNSEGCQRHTALVVKYNGNVDYEAFEYSAETSCEGHHSISSSDNWYSNLSVAVNEVENIIGTNLTFVPTDGYYYTDTCGGCGILTGKHYYLYSDDEEIRIHVEYDNGTISYWNWGYNGHFEDLQMAKDEASKYGFEAEWATYGAVRLSLWQNSSNSSKDANVNVGLYSDEVRFTLSVYGIEMRAETYYVTECREIMRTYFKREGEWILNSTVERAEHTYREDVVFGEHCNEDGYYHTDSCVYCGYGNEKIEIMHGHNTSGYGFGGMVSYYGEQLNLTEENLEDIYAELTCSNFCYFCNTLINVQIVLLSDWILNSDVYLKAEGLVIDLNGHNIDLNGHNLVLYSYDGKDIEFTDNTSSSKITNSEETGIFIVATEYGTVTGGTIEVDCETFASDTDNRYTLFDSVKEATGYELFLLEAEEFVVPEK